MDTLPKHILEIILSYLNYQRLSICECVSHEFRDICTQYKSKHIKKMNLSYSIREIVRSNNIRSFYKLLKSVSSYEDRKKYVIECTILCIYHTNANFLESLLKNFKKIIYKNINHILSIALLEKIHDIPRDIINIFDNIGINIPFNR